MSTDHSKIVEKFLKDALAYEGFFVSCPRMRSILDSPEEVETRRTIMLEVAELLHIMGVEYETNSGACAVMVKRRSEFIIN